MLYFKLHDHKLESPVMGTAGTGAHDFIKHGHAASPLVKTSNAQFYKVYCEGPEISYSVFYLNSTICSSQQECLFLETLSLPMTRF